MTCYHPLKAYRSREVNPSTGRHLITFNPLKNLVEGSSLTLPCGRCIGCRLERSRQWAVRCTHEAQLHTENCFITLTFSNDHLPPDYSVHVRTWQLFMKRLRKELGSKKIRSFACGEYGETNLRPHYHAIIFNHYFPDALLYKTVNGNNLYTSQILSKIWPYGHAILGDVTFESAAYVARYVMKKYTGDQSDAHYTRVHPLTKEIVRVQPEFVTQSRRPGLGAPWLEKYRSDVYPDDFVIARNMKMKPPRFYDQQLTEEELEELKRRRKKTGRQFAADSTPDRLAVRETVKVSKLKCLKRTLE